MRILMVHNAYQQRGGEDAVVEAEAAMLAAHGHHVRQYMRHNDEIGSTPKLGLAAQTIWSAQSAKEITQAVTDFKPDVVHFHNNFPLISPVRVHGVRRIAVRPRRPGSAEQLEVVVASC